jgi:Tfp pilus assembly protein PilW
VNINARGRSGLTLFEIIVSLMILALVMVGLGNVFVASRRYLRHSRSRIQASEVMKFLLSPLQGAVRQDTYDTGDLATGSHTGSQVFLEDTFYNSTLTVSNVVLPGSTNIRRVQVSVQWYEPGP